jgi:hypothetical protein
VALSLTLLCAGQIGTASAVTQAFGRVPGSRFGSVPMLTPPAGDWRTLAQNVYDKTAPDGSTDLVLAFERVFGRGATGSQPTDVAGAASLGYPPIFLAGAP